MPVKIYITDISIFSGGAAGSRTRVQTRRPYAFYMLSSDLVFVHKLDQNHRLMPYLLNFASTAERSTS